MKIAIHKREGSYSDGWIKYCENQGITYKIVNCFDTDIVETIKDCNGLLCTGSTMIQKPNYLLGN